jgi:hypothetical protein
MMAITASDARTGLLHLIQRVNDDRKTNRDHIAAR